MVFCLLAAAMASLSLVNNTHTHTHTLTHSLMQTFCSAPAACALFDNPLAAPQSMLQNRQRAQRQQERSRLSEIYIFNCLPYYGFYIELFWTYLVYCQLALRPETSEECAKRVRESLL